MHIVYIQAKVFTRQNPKGLVRGRVLSALSDPALADPALSDPALSDPALSDPALSDPALSDPALADPALSNWQATAPAAGPAYNHYGEGLAC
jgi:hypothetical protein